MAYQLYTKNELGEIVAVVPGIDERVSNLETTVIELNKNKIDVRDQELTAEQKEQVVQNLAGTFLPLSGGTLTGSLGFNTDSRSSLSIVEDDQSLGSEILLYPKSSTEAEFSGCIRLVARSSDVDYGVLDLFSNGSLQWRGKEVERVNSKGVGWIRYENGLQVCWGYAATSTNNMFKITFPVPFLDKNYAVSALPTWGNSPTIPSLAVKDGETDSTNTYFTFLGTTHMGFKYIFVGYWK